MDAETPYLSDRELLDRYYRDSDNVWIGQLLERYLHLVLGVCSRYLKEPEASRDLTQQVCLKVLKDLRRHRVRHFKPWLYQVTRNECLMHLRERKRHGWIALEDPAIAETEQEDPVPRLEQEKQFLQLERALEQLNEPQKRCVSLFYLKKKSYQEISDETGFSLMKVKSYIQNGKRNLRLLMEPPSAGSSGPDQEPRKS